MSWAPPLLVAVPLLTAAVVAGGDHLLPRRVQDALAILAELIRSPVPMVASLGILAPRAP